eukprot:Anaeramoba_ignava/c20380_g1_i3.p2 GENE.c20380_g1_i3~~c20380_g1_i3.p2  ORF type:complete len:114 (+),score=18.33 c20380_g1_i3:2232-2573(+)
MGFCIFFIELTKINKFSSPLLKVDILTRCAQLVMNILLFQGIKEVGADITLPIMIYIVIIANPPQFPSNIKYIEIFLDKQLLTSTSEYWWTIFRSSYSYLENFNLENLPRTKK